MSEKDETPIRGIIESPPEVKEILDKIKDVDFPKLIDLYSKILDSYGDFMLSFGTIEKEYGEYLPYMSQLTEFAPSLVGKYLEKASPDNIRELFVIFLKMYYIFPKLSRMMELNPDEKIIIGESLKDLAKDFQLLKKVGEEK